MQFTTSFLFVALFAAVTQAATIPAREPDLEARCVCTPEGCVGVGCVGPPTHGGRDLEERCSGSRRREPNCPPTMNGSLCLSKTPTGLFVILTPPVSEGLRKSESSAYSNTLASASVVKKSLPDTSLITDNTITQTSVPLTFPSPGFGRRLLDPQRL
ncbi:hypothetical protein DFH08DRAFT_799699 [Mycena albidolilacea]|uniref:Uncharacterized protein n=1 Tax=Mycena albidolilacea TaxID=1033008 RepID=A0AAD7AM85_9AGAR|nr:hypothetical protein DFH08DRAFT_799699 [Mycena albidolilacea]